jgi:hypothetical protein
MPSPTRCAVCALTVKWGQERTILDERRDPPTPITVCPVCAVERGQWRPLEAGGDR